MTGEALTQLQARQGLSDHEFMKALGMNDTAAALRRFRRWKTGRLAIPDAIADAARRLVEPRA